MKVIIAVAVGALGFFGGMQYQKSQRPSFSQNQNGITRRFGQNQNGQVVRGEIINADQNSITIKMRDGSTKIIILSGNTNITKAASGSKEDLKSGNQVMVFGTNNSDGSVTAQVVQLNPMFGAPTNSPSK